MPDNSDLKKGKVKKSGGMFGKKKKPEPVPEPEAKKKNWWTL